MSVISDNIKTLRQKLGLNQKEFAEKLGISFRVLQDYERGLHEPRSSMIQKIAELGNVSFNWLLSGQETEEGLWSLGEETSRTGYDTAFKQAMQIPENQRLLCLISEFPVEKQRELASALIKIVEMAKKE